jgi:predicted RNA-binding protein YlqC (UPF0109 family)
MKELIEYIARSLVDNPLQVTVNQVRNGGIIGKSGRVANAMRVLLRVAAARDGKQAALDVVEPR